MKIQVIALLFSILGAQTALAVDPDFPCSPRHPTECGSSDLRGIQPTFIASGGSCFVYQDISDALEQAKKFADANARQICGNVKAWRVSEYHRISSVVGA